MSLRASKVVGGSLALVVLLGGCSNRDPQTAEVGPSVGNGSPTAQLPPKAVAAQKSPPPTRPVTAKPKAPDLDPASTAPPDPFRTQERPKRRSAHERRDPVLTPPPSPSRIAAAPADEFSGLKREEAASSISEAKTSKPAPLNPEAPEAPVASTDTPDVTSPDARGRVVSPTAPVPTPSSSPRKHRADSSPPSHANSPSTIAPKPSGSAPPAVRVKSEEKKRIAWARPGLPRAAPKPEGAEQPRLAVIIDDIGMSTEQLAPFLAIDADLTYSIIPETKQAKRCLELIQSRGRHPMLHLPMEPLRRKSLLQADGISVGLGDAEIGRRVNRFLDELPGVEGVNNHMGSLATQNERVMRSVLGPVRDRGLFFVDSKTADITVVAKIAEEEGIPHAARSGEFLDDGGNTTRAYEILLNLAREARRTGSAIGIGHPHAGTRAAIARAVPVILRMGVKIVPAGDLVQ